MAQETERSRNYEHVREFIVNHRGITYANLYGTPSHGL